MKKNDLNDEGLKKADIVFKSGEVKIGEIKNNEIGHFYIKFKGGKIPQSLLDTYNGHLLKNNLFTILKEHSDRLYIKPSSQNGKTGCYISNETKSIAIALGAPAEEFINSLGLKDLVKLELITIHNTKNLLGPDTSRLYFNSNLLSKDKESDTLEIYKDDLVKSLKKVIPTLFLKDDIVAEFTIRNTPEPNNFELVLSVNDLTKQILLNLYDKNLFQIDTQDIKKLVILPQQKENDIGFYYTPKGNIGINTGNKLPDKLFDLLALQPYVDKNLISISPENNSLIISKYALSTDHSTLKVHKSDPLGSLVSSLVLKDNIVAEIMVCNSDNAKTALTIKEWQKAFSSQQSNPGNKPADFNIVISANELTKQLLLKYYEGLFQISPQDSTKIVINSSALQNGAGYNIFTMDDLSITMDNPSDFIKLLNLQEFVSNGFMFVKGNNLIISKYLLSKDYPTLKVHNSDPILNNVIATQTSDDAQLYAKQLMALIKYFPYSQWLKSHPEEIGKFEKSLRDKAGDAYKVKVISENYHGSVTIKNISCEEVKVPFIKWDNPVLTFNLHSKFHAKNLFELLAFKQKITDKKFQGEDKLSITGMERIIEGKDGELALILSPDKAKPFVDYLELDKYISYEYISYDKEKLGIIHFIDGESKITLPYKNTKPEGDCLNLKLLGDIGGDVGLSDH